MNHQFAFYNAHLEKDKTTHIITEQEIVHRISRVLRLAVGDSIIFFNREYNAQGTIESIDKKKVVINQLLVQSNQPLKPEINYLLPILKREAFEHAVYCLVEAGVNHIYPVIASKSQRAWGGSKERDRLERLMISAAEQSKNFSFAVLHDPVSLEQAVQKVQSEQRIFFDPSGQPFKQQFCSLPETSITLMIGPEGDLTDEEKSIIKKHNFISVRLTPTILRAQEAAGFTACMIRSLFTL